jgi:hypothetical protein
LLSIHDVTATNYAEQSVMQLGATEDSEMLRSVTRNGMPLLLEDRLPNAKWLIAPGKAAQVANESLSAA